MTRPDDVQAMGKNRFDGWNAQFEWKPQDMWIGLFWKRQGSCVDLWVCMLPCVPLHISWWWKHDTTSRPDDAVRVVLARIEQLERDLRDEKYGKAVASVSAMREITEEAEGLTEQAQRDAIELLQRCEHLERERDEAADVIRKLSEVEQLQQLLDECTIAVGEHCTWKEIPARVRWLKAERNEAMHQTVTAMGENKTLRAEVERLKREKETVSVPVSECTSKPGGE